MDDQKIPERKRSSASHCTEYSTACSALHLGFWKDRNEDEQKKKNPHRGGGSEKVDSWKGLTSPPTSPNHNAGESTSSTFSPGPSAKPPLDG